MNWRAVGECLTLCVTCCGLPNTEILQSGTIANSHVSYGSFENGQRFLTKVDLWIPCT